MPAKITRHGLAGALIVAGATVVLIYAISTAASRSHAPDVGVQYAAMPSALFQGMSTLESANKQPAVNGTFARVAGESHMEISIATDEVSVAQSMAIDSSASVSFLGIGGASAKKSFLESLELNSFSTTVLASARVGLRMDSALSYELMRGVAPVTTAEEAKVFFGLYGDSFVDSITFGAEYYAALVIHSSSIEEKQSVSTALGAGGIFKGISANADTQKAIDNFRKESKFRMVRAPRQRPARAAFTS